MSSRICRSAAGPMFVLVVSMTRSTLMVVGRCAWATPNPVTSTSVSHPRLVVVHGTTTTACCRNSSTSSEVTTMAGRTNPGSPRAGVPKSQRTMSPARISNVARRRIEHGLVAGIEWDACELSPDDAATLPSDQLLDLCVEGEPLTVSEPAQSIPSLDGDLDGSCIRHTKEYTSSPIAYGMTETSPVSTQTSADDPLEKRVNTLGRVHPHAEIKITDPDTGRVMPRGDGGEVLIRGYSVMLDYWNDPERTAAAIDADGWMHTGDLAVTDDDGYVNIVGRIKDMIIRGGENVYPREVEEFPYNHPDIVEVQVTGVPDARYGEEVMAWVQLRDDADTTAEDVKDFCRGTIAHYKIPRYVGFTDAFPMTITGKIQEFKMRDQSISELGLAAAAAVPNP